MDSNSELNKPNYINNMWLGNCFACSSTNKRGLKMKFFYDKEGISSRLKLHEDFCGFEGIVHGGIIATILDEIGAWTIFACLKKLAVTQDSRIKYLKPVYTNQLLKAEGKIINQNNTIITTHSIIKDDKSNILAECKNKWLCVSSEALAKISNIDIDRINKMVNRALETL